MEPMKVVIKALLVASIVSVLANLWLNFRFAFDQPFGAIRTWETVKLITAIVPTLAGAYLAGRGRWSKCGWYAMVIGLGLIVLSFATPVL
jgi:hypothetical protein